MAVIAAAGKADIGASDAFLSPATLAKYSHLVNIPLAVAALMMVYNVPGVSASAHLRLDGTVLTRIFIGKISRWDDPAIAALNPAVKLPGTVSRVKSAPGSIGYVGVSYLSQVMNANEGEAALGNSSGTFVLPTARAIQAALASFTNTPASETISLINGAAAQAYPIINYEYAVVNTSQLSATRAQDLRAFLTWAVTSGTAQLAKVNFQPLPPSVITLSDAQIARIRGRAG